MDYRSSLTRLGDTCFTTAGVCAMTSRRGGQIEGGGAARGMNQSFSRSTFATSHAATAAVTDPTTAIPTTMRATAMTRPVLVTG